MNREGRWIARHPEREIAGFTLNGLVSPWRTWADVMTLWGKAQGNHERLKVFVTHVLAEPWKSSGERIEVHTLVERSEPCDPIPAVVGPLFGAIDVQKDRLESVLIGVAPGEEIWILEWGQHEGEPTQDEPWKDAWEFLTAPRGAPLVGIGIDTGFLTDQAWHHVDAWHGKRGIRVLGLKGVPGRGRPWITRPSRVVSKSQRRPWLVGVDTAKDALAMRLRAPVPPGGAAAVHVADTLDEAFFDQLTSEELRTVLVQGRQQRVWRPIPGRRNEGLDLTVYALATLYSMGQAFLGTIAAVASARGPVASTEPQPEAPKGMVLPSPMIRPPGGGWVTGWRR
jgi:phage terminase large subunit GpA-like protein